MTVLSSYIKDDRICFGGKWLTFNQWREYCFRVGSHRMGESEVLKMTARSTRNKMRWQCEMIMKNLTRCQGHLKLLGDLSGGESEQINITVSNLVVLSEMFYQTIKTFREGL